MVLTKKNVLMASAGVAIAFNFSACKKDKESQTDKLVGEWEVISIDGETPGPDDGVTTMEFDADQDFKYCYEDDSNKYCYNGDWEWANDDEDEVEINITYSGYNINIDIDIDELSSDRLEGDLNILGDVASVVMKKL